MASKVQAKFSVTARIVIISEIEVTADSFEEAVTKAKALKETDFVTVDGDHHDSSISLVSINKLHAWNVD
jgi:hypothetical protein